MRPLWGLVHSSPIDRKRSKGARLNYLPLPKNLWVLSGRMGSALAANIGFPATACRRQFAPGFFSQMKWRMAPMRSAADRMEHSVAGSVYAARSCRPRAKEAIAGAMRDIGWSSRLGWKALRTSHTNKEAPAFFRPLLSQPGLETGSLKWPEGTRDDEALWASSKEGRNTRSLRRPVRGPTLPGGILHVESRVEKGDGLFALAFPLCLAQHAECEVDAAAHAAPAPAALDRRMCGSRKNSRLTVGRNSCHGIHPFGARGPRHPRPIGVISPPVPPSWLPVLRSACLS